MSNRNQASQAQAPILLGISALAGPGRDREQIAVKGSDQMSKTLYVRKGRPLEFPVSANHELAGHQEIRMPAREEILQNSFYARIVQEHVATLAPGGRSRSSGNTALTNSVTDRIIARIGPSWIYNLPNFDIVVETDAVMYIRGSWNWMYAGNFIVQPGGLVQVFSTDSQLPAFLLLKCSSFGTEGFGFKGVIEK
jgi:hypothetical protein